MPLIDLKLTQDPELKPGTRQMHLMKEVESIRKVAASLIDEERYRDALERIVEGLRTLRDYPEPDSDPFRMALVALLFDLAEIHYTLRDYRQSEKELEILFKVLGVFIKKDSERYGHLHILAMDLSTRILRSRRKAMDLLARQQTNVAALYEKVNAGMAAATDRLVDSLRKVASLLASAGDYKGSMKFYSEAIKFSKKRSGRITRKEVKMTIEMAEIMMRVRSMRPRAKRLLEAILPYAIALGTIELEEDILALVEVIDADIEREPLWRSMLRRVSLAARGRSPRDDRREKEEDVLMARDETVIDPASLTDAKTAAKESRRSARAEKKARAEAARALREAEKAEKADKAEENVSD